MTYIKIDENGRIQSVGYDEHLGPGEIEVTLPEGDVFDYRYVNGEWVYDPKPKDEPKTPEPTVSEILDTLLGVE